MTSLIRSAAALCLFLASSSALDGELNTQVNFFEPEYKTGVIYVQSSVLHQTSSVNIAGQDMETVMDMEMTNEMSVADLEEGGKEITLTYTHIAMDMSTMGMDFHFDSNDAKSSEDEKGALNPFAMVSGLVGEPMKIIVDDDYNVVKVETSGDASLLATLRNNDATKDLASAKQFEQTASIVRSLPAIGVSEGDKWDFNLDMDGGMVHFEGEGTLVGLASCEKMAKHQCATILMDGEMNLDLSKVVVPGAQGMKVKDGKMSTTMAWDMDDTFARSTDITTEMTMEMTNPVDNSLMEIPIHQTVTVTMDIMM